MGSTELVRQMGASAIWDVLDRARRRWRGVLATEGALRALTVFLAALIICFALDNLFHLGGTARLVLGMVALLATFGIVIRRAIWPLVRPINDEMTAVHVERALPSLDNRLINAVQFSEELQGYDHVARELALRQIEETIETVDQIPVSHTTDTRPVRKWGLRAAVAIAAIAVYIGFWGQYVGNALTRYTSPFAYHPPITRTRLTVTPGNVELLEGQRLVVEAKAEGEIPHDASIRFSFDEKSRPTERPMPFQGDRFVFVFESVQKPFAYHVSAGDARSPDYHVVVRKRPRIVRTDLLIRYPAYMGMAEHKEEKSAGNIVAPVGADVEMTIEADRPLKRVWAEFEWIVVREDEAVSEKETLKFDLRGQTTAVANIRVTRSGQYRVFLEDQSLVANEPVVRQIVAQPDNAPYVSVTSPGKNVALAPEQKLVILAKAQDDYGLRNLTFFLQQNEKDGFKSVRKWDYEAGKKLVNEGVTVDLGELKAAAGQTLLYYWQAADGLDRKDAEAGRSPVYQISVIASRTLQAESEEADKRLRDVLRRLVRMQEENITATARLLDWLGKEAGEMAEKPEIKRRFMLMVEPTVEQETAIYTEITKTVKELEARESSTVLTELSALAATEVTAAVRELKQLQGAAAAPEAVTLAKEAIVAEDRVLKRLKELLGRLEMSEKLAEKNNLDEEDLAEDEQFKDGRDRIKALLKKMDDFKKEQQEVIKLTNKLAEKEAENFTEDDKLDQRNIAKTEEKWAKIFKEAATDVSKLPEQDFSLATQAKELVEMFTELQAKLDEAAEAAKKNIEIACPIEEAGLELAKSIESNLERWLPEDKDTIKWAMEEPTTQSEVPLADLPEELEDIVGDLLDDAEQMDEDVEDVTSGWLDSLDKGAGWDAMDGPISNMTAKGVTGNRLPNDMEIGGRSGEGRTGKSSGQFVEEEARGKGGRQTPTRMTADPFEPGSVKDTSPEPATGSTGGGKLSGEGQEGLRGPIPPAMKQQLRRMANMQQQLIQQAERLDHGLDKHKYPKGQLPETIQMMKQFQNAADRGEFKNYAKMHRVILSNLRDVKGVVAQQKKLNRDRSARIPKEIRDEISSSLKEKAPKEYRDLVEEYFKSLSKTD